MKKIVLNWSKEADEIAGCVLLTIFLITFNERPCMRTMVGGFK